MPNLSYFYFLLTSVLFRPGPPPPSPAQIQKILDENCGLIQTIQDYQNMGKAVECMSYHQALHRNLVYLAQLADSTQNMAQLLPVRQHF
jgi:SSXT protein (N-terminal region)